MSVKSVCITASDPKRLSTRSGNVRSNSAASSGVKCALSAKSGGRSRVVTVPLVQMPWRSGRLGPLRWARRGADTASANAIETARRVFMNPLVTLTSTLYRRLSRRPKLFCERIRADLELDELGARAFAAFLMPRRITREGRPQTTSLPARPRIVDAALCRPREESHRVRDAQLDKLPGLRDKSQQRIGIHRAGDGYILAKTQRVVSVNVRQVQKIRVVGSVGGRYALERRARLQVNTPTFGAVLARRGRSIRHLALSTVEARHVVGATPVEPDDPAGVDAHTTRPVNGGRIASARCLEHFGLAGLRRIGPALDSHQLVVARTNPRAPDASIDLVDRQRVAPEADPVILLRIDRLVDLGPLRDLAIAGGVEHGRAPALSGFRALALVELGGVDPAEDVVLPVVHRVLGTRAEMIVVGGEAGINRRELFGFGIERHHLSIAGRLHREVLREPAGGTRLAKSRLLTASEPRRQPEP